MTCIPSQCSSSDSLVTAEEVQRSIEFVQAELSRVQRACEYRAQHPYNRAATTQGSELDDARREERGGRAPGREESAGTSWSARKPASSHFRVSSTAKTTTPLGYASKKSTDRSRRGGARGKGGAPPRVVLSFSAFEKHRMAQVLGRVALELSAVWAYVHQWTAMSETSTTTTTTTTSPSSVPMSTPRGPRRQASERSVATAAPASEHRGPHEQHALDSPSRPHPPSSQTPEVEGDKEQVLAASAATHEVSIAETTALSMNYNPAAQLDALQTLIKTATAIQQMLAGAGDAEGDAKDEDEEAALPATLNAEALTSETLGQDNTAPGTSCPPCSHSAPNVPSTTPQLPVSSNRAHSPTPSASHTPHSADRRRSSDSRSRSRSHHHTEPDIIAIPDYLRAYVLEASGEAAVEGENAENDSVKRTETAAVAQGDRNAIDEGGEEEEDDDATVIVNADRGDSRSVSAGSTANGILRSVSRASEWMTHSHAESSHTSPSSAQPTAEASTSVGGGTAGGGGGLGGGGGAGASSSSGSAARLHGLHPSSHNAAHSIIAHHRFDSEVNFNAPSSPFKRVISNSSLRSSSLIGSPVQTQQQQQQHQPLPQQQHAQGLVRAQGYTTCSVPSQHLHHSSRTGERSPDSAEMSPAAVAAYSRSTSLLRRPHRLEVPISRTQSLRRVPSSTSPESMACGSPHISSHAVSPATSTTGAGVSTTQVPVTASSSGHAFTASAQGPASFPVFKSQSSSYHQRLHSGSGVGAYVQGGPALASSPPIGLSTSGAGDSPHSSIAGLHFQRVISVDSENGGWPPGSLADSLEMSQLKVSALSGRLGGALVYSTNVTPLPAPHETGAPGHAFTELVEVAGGGGGGGHASPAACADTGATSTASSTVSNAPAAHRRGDAAYGGGQQSRTVVPAAAARGGVVSPVRATPPAVAMVGAGLGSSGASGSFKAPKPGFAAHSRPPSFSSVASSALGASTHGQQPLRSATPNSNSLRGGPAAPSPLPPNSYTINAKKLKEFLQCVRDLTQTDFSEEEFDSMRLFYFLPGVSLVKSASRGGAETADNAATAAATPTAAAGKDEPPLPLFDGGERVPVRLSKLDVFYSLVIRKVKEVCDNIGISATPFLSVA